MIVYHGTTLRISNSHLAGMIAKGDTGVQYLDYKYLVGSILENQKDLCGV